MLENVPPNYFLLLDSLDDGRWSTLHRLVLAGRERLRDSTPTVGLAELLSQGGVGFQILQEMVQFWSLPRLDLLGSELLDPNLKSEYRIESEGVPALLELNLSWLERIANPIVRSDMLCWLILRGSVQHGIFHLDGGLQMDRVVNVTLSTVMDRARLRIRVAHSSDGSIGTVLLPSRASARATLEL